MIELKTTEELKKMREAGKITALALHTAGKYIQPGISTQELDQIVEKTIRQAGATPSFLGYGGFPASVCVSVNHVVIHGIPSKKQILKAGDIVSLDVGAFYEGYHGDSAYTFACGEISPEAKALCEVTKQSLELAIQAAVPGNRVGDIGAAVQSFCEAKGYSVVRDFTGHGVGSHLHEDPSVPNHGRAGHGVRLMPGMVIAIEPMINQGHWEVKVLQDGWTTVTKDGSLSAHFEHTVGITETGNVILTAV